MMMTELPGKLPSFHFLGIIRLEVGEEPGDLWSLPGRERTLWTHGRGSPGVGIVPDLWRLRSPGDCSRGNIPGT